jgi:hypothetical protein
MVRYWSVSDSKARIRGLRRNATWSMALAAMTALAVGSSSGVARAATCTWNSAVAANFATAGKWSGCGNPNNIPSTGDTAVFDGTGVGNCTIAADPGLAAISINSGYTGTVTQSAGVGIT